jgi:hypothetical protein
MRHVVALLSCLCLTEWSQALADPPPESSASQAAVTSAPPAASPTAPAAATAPAAPASASASPPAAKPPSDAVSDAEDKALHSQGYKKEVHDGQTYYCRSEAALGTHFEKKTCRSAYQIMADRRDARDAFMPPSRAAGIKSQ